jgi:hypothetical protein
VDVSRQLSTHLQDKPDLNCASSTWYLADTKLTPSTADPQHVVQKNILGLVQGSPCKIDVTFSGENDEPCNKATVKSKQNETEELPLFTNKQTVMGEVGLPWSCHTGRPFVMAAMCR